MDLYEKLLEELKRAVRILPPDVEALIMSARSREESVLGRMVLDRIAENISAARSGPVPLCQDCGMFHALVRVGRSCPYSMAEIGDEITRACRDAAEAAWYRRSTVSDPVYDRVNTGDNLPVVFNWELVDGTSVTADILLKGFGSENCSSVRMLRPTDGEDGVIGAVLDMVRVAGGKPCPPMFLGIGIGGTMDKAAMLSKKALVREAGSRHPDPRYAKLEETILERVNSLGIGPGGLGGCCSALSVAVETCHTHIAGLPVALSVNCWADRKAHVEVM